MRYRNKYNAKRSGSYDSGAEKEYGGVLEALRLTGEIAAYEHHPPAMVFINGVKWNVDFLVTDNNGRKCYAEVKGKKLERYGVVLQLWKYEKPAPLIVVRKYGPHRFRAIEEVDTDGIEWYR